jgi:hypothetical protein
MKILRGRTRARPDPFTDLALTSSIINMLMIPHPVIGIALLGLAGKKYWLGRIISNMVCVTKNAPGNDTTKFSRLIDALGISHLLHRSIVHLSMVKRSRPLICR